MNLFHRREKMTQRFCFSQGSCLQLTQEKITREGSSKHSIKLCSLGQDQNNCLVLDVEQTSFPSKCSHLSQDTWSK